jgi:uncharacterized protein YkwD
MQHHQGIDRRFRSRHTFQAQNRRRTNLQSIPENDSKDFGLDPNQYVVPCASQASVPSPLPPLFPRLNVSPSTAILISCDVSDNDDDDDDVTPFELVTYERRKRGLLPFRLSRELNHLASQQAYRMAMDGKVYHSVSTVDELKILLMGNDVAENIHRGDTMSTMHAETMRQSSCINRSNVLSIYFSDFGYGLATGRDGKLYCCQLFRN